MVDVRTKLHELGTTEEVANAVTESLPSVNGNTRIATLSTLHDTSRHIQDHLVGQQGLSSGDSVAKDHNAWITAFGSFANQDNDNGAMGYDADTHGVIVGADGKLNNQNRIGVAFAYSTTDVDADTLAKQEADIDSLQAILYGSYSIDSANKLGWQVGLGRHENDITRDIPFMAVVASSSHHSRSVHVGVNYDRQYILNPQTTVIPSVRLDYAFLDEDSYSERGADALNLHVDSETTSELIAGVGGELAYSMTEQVSISAKLGLGYDFLADDHSLTSYLAGAPSDPFLTPSVGTGSLFVDGGAGLIFGGKDSPLQWNLFYDADGRQDFINQTVSLKMKMPY
jgi:outer membrane autotransporter protein